MQNFNRLVQSLDQTTSTLKKIEALTDYFRTAPAEDACWGLYLLSGEKISTKVNRTFLQETFTEFISMPLWLFKESYYQVGDSAETMSLLRGPLNNPLPPPSLSTLVDDLKSLAKMSDEDKKRKLHQWWQTLDEESLFILHKCFTGGLRLGVSKNLLIQSLALVAGVDKSPMSLRLMGDYEPTVESFLSLLGEDKGLEKSSKPYPFFLASQVEAPEEEFLKWDEWCVEWKWDGIRAQVVKRGGEVFIWSRGEELVTETFPEIVLMARGLPDGTVLDGEILPWRDGKVMSFSDLQKRLNRKKITKKDLEETPISLMAYDLLEFAGTDIREWPLKQRRKKLEELSPFPLSDLVSVSNIDEAKELRLQSRERGVEGFMLKRWSSPYQVGRRRGDWWKWKIDPLTVDCVLLYVQSGSGRRSGLDTDYTLAVWKGAELVPVTKAYSGLSDEELVEVDRWAKKHTLEKFGPVRSVTPQQVFEIGFEGIQRSPRHKSGVALRFPRILRWRKDKRPEEANHLSDLERLLTP